MVRHSDHGFLYTSWAVDTGDKLLDQSVMITTILKDLGESVLWLSHINDTERLNTDAVPRADNIVAVGPNGSDQEYGDALRNYAIRHGVKRVYRVMYVGPVEDET